MISLPTAAGREKHVHNTPWVLGQSIHDWRRLLLLLLRCRRCRWHVAILSGSAVEDGVWLRAAHSSLPELRRCRLVGCICSCMLTSKTGCWASCSAAGPRLLRPLIRLWLFAQQMAAQLHRLRPLRPWRRPSSGRASRLPCWALQSPTVAVPPQLPATAHILHAGGT